MNPFRSRPIALLLVAFTVGAVGLLAPESARAAQALFRVQRTFLGAPFPGVQTPGCTLGVDCPGRFENSLTPYVPHSGGQLTTAMGATAILPPGTEPLENPAVAIVSPGNPVGAKFTLPRSFIDYQGTFEYYASTAFAGYTSISVVDYFNGLAKFGPNNPNGAAAATTVTIHDRYPATVGGAYTTTHGGRFDFDRNGYLKIDPGTNNFGGTMRILYRPSSSYYQYVYVASPLLFKGFGSFTCTKMGVNCTEGFVTEVGEATSSGMVSRVLLTTSLPKYLWSTRDKETPLGSPYTSMVYRHKLADPPAITKNYYLHLNAPWTTGSVEAFNDQLPTSGYGVHPHGVGYDKVIAGGNVDLTRTYTTITYQGQGKTNYNVRKYYTKLTGVTRAVSLVKPRLTHTYNVPRIATDPIFSNYQANRVQIMKVFFLPEPAGALMVAAGIAVLLGLSRIRWR